MDIGLPFNSKRTTIPIEILEKIDKFDDDTSSTYSITERSRWPPLTRMLMSGDFSSQPPRPLSIRDKLNRWMVNEGHRRLFVLIFALAHMMVFAFGFLNYDLKR